MNPFNLKKTVFAAIYSALSLAAVILLFLNACRHASIATQFWGKNFYDRMQEYLGYTIMALFCVLPFFLFNLCFWLKKTVIIRELDDAGGYRPSIVWRKRIAKILLSLLTAAALISLASLVLYHATGAADFALRHSYYTTEKSLEVLAKQYRQWAGILTAIGALLVFSVLSLWTSQGLYIMTFGEIRRHTQQNMERLLRRRIKTESGKCKKIQQFNDCIKRLELNTKSKQEEFDKRLAALEATLQKFV